MPSSCAQPILPSNKITLKIVSNVDQVNSNRILENGQGDYFSVAQNTQVGICET